MYVSIVGPGLSPEHMKSLFSEGMQVNPNKLQAGIQYYIKLRTIVNI
jgi:hypothetical protein